MENYTVPQCKVRPTLHVSAWMNLRNTMLSEGMKSQKRACESIKIVFKSRQTEVVISLEM